MLVPHLSQEVFKFHNSILLGIITAISVTITPSTIPVVRISITIASRRTTPLRITALARHRISLLDLAQILENVHKLPNDLDAFKSHLATIGNCFKLVVNHVLQIFPNLSIILHRFTPPFYYLVTFKSGLMMMILALRTRIGISETFLTLTVSQHPRQI